MAETTGELSQALSNAIVALMAEYTGRGATQSRTYVHENLIVCVMHDQLTKGERRLVADGKMDFVINMRRAYQDTMREELTAIVERLTGRKVAAFMSDHHIDPDVAVETFVLELREPIGAVPDADSGCPGSLNSAAWISHSRSTSQPEEDKTGQPGIDVHRASAWSQRQDFRFQAERARLP